MPEYSFSNPKKPKEVIDIIMSMNEVHEYIKDGVKWNRIFFAPQASIDTKLDAFDNKAFIDKVGKNKGTLGDALDRSKELSEIRKEKRGVDPIKEQHLKKWKSERAGDRKHPSEIKKVEITAS